MEISKHAIKRYQQRVKKSPDDVAERRILNCINNTEGRKFGGGTLHYAGWNTKFGVIVKGNLAVTVLHNAFLLHR